MTVTNEKLRRRELEMARGAEVIAYAERVARVERYSGAPGMTVVRLTIAGDLEFNFEGAPIAYANDRTPGFPTDELLATLALVLQARQGLPEPIENSPPGREYNRRMQANERQTMDSGGP